MILATEVKKDSLTIGKETRHFTKYEVTAELEHGYKYEVFIIHQGLDRHTMNVERSSIQVSWSRYGEYPKLQRISKTFWDWEALANNYRKLAPHINEVRAAMEQLYEGNHDAANHA